MQKKVQDTLDLNADVKNYLLLNWQMVVETAKKLRKNMKNKEVHVTD